MRTNSYNTNGEFFTDQTSTKEAMLAGYLHGGWLVNATRPPDFGLTSVLLLLLLLLPLFTLFALDDAGVRDILRAVVGVAGSRRAEAEPAPLGVECTDDAPDTSVGGEREGVGYKRRNLFGQVKAARLDLRVFPAVCTGVD